MEEIKQKHEKGDKMFTDSIVLITGAASGIGYEASRQFINEGATVIGVDFNEAKLQDTENILGDKFVSKLCDAGNEGQIRALFKDVDQKFGKLDVLVNNAGSTDLIDPEELEEEIFYKNINVLLKGPMLLVKHFAPLLRKSANPSIVNIASLAAIVEAPKHFLYAAAKAGLDKFTRSCAKDLPGIRSNCILPGVIETPILDIYGEELLAMLRKNITQRCPCGRTGKPDDIANCILFLCSDKATYINGASIVIDGGLHQNADIGYELPAEMI